MPALNPPALRPFDSAKIPATLRSEKRWAPWEAVWSEKRQKFDKIPCHPNGYRLSTAKPEKWYSWDVALAAVQGNPGRFAGLGFVMTGASNLTGVDLDNCVSGNSIAPWAQTIVDALASYTELSPSGNGLRIWCEGMSPNDWTNHEQGIEVYSGHEPRFLTVTGHRLKKSGEALATLDPAVLAGIATQWARERTTASVTSIAMPELLDDLVLPDVADLELPPKVKDWLTEGEVTGDRSRVLAHTAVALYSLGLTDAEVFSIMATNPHCMEVALDHRHQDEDRARAYLWREQCVKGKPKASSKIATAADFDDVTPVGEAAAPGAAPAPKRDRFDLMEEGEFLQGKRGEWLIKRVLPMAEVGVVYGPSGAGKSFLVIDLCMAVARGLPWRGNRAKQGKVAYVVAEGVAGFRDRIQAYKDFHGLAEAVPMLYLPAAPNLIEKGDVKDLVKALKKHPDITLIVFDTFAQVTPGADENSGESMGRALAHCRAIHDATGAMVLLVAHSGKDVGREVRGWSGIKGALDVQILVDRSGDDRSAIVQKVKDGMGEGVEYGFSLDGVVLGKDSDGDDITSCVLKERAVTQRMDRKASKVKGKWQVQAMGAYEALVEFEGPVTEKSIVDHVMATSVWDGEGQDRRRDRLAEALDALCARGVLVRGSDGVSAL